MTKDEEEQIKHMQSAMRVEDLCLQFSNGLRHILTQAESLRTEPGVSPLFQTLLDDLDAALKKYEVPIKTEFTKALSAVMTHLHEQAMKMKAEREGSE